MRRSRPLATRCEVYEALGTAPQGVLNFHLSHLWRLFDFFWLFRVANNFSSLLRCVDRGTVHWLKGRSSTQCFPQPILAAQVER